jgi:hypothetical protein
MTPAPYTEDTLVQQTTAEYLEQELGLAVGVRLQQRGFRTGQPAGPGPRTVRWC